jgi:asparagine synthase (glutamine-hydrolysing)
MSDIYRQGWPDFVPKLTRSSVSGLDVAHHSTRADILYDDFIYYLPDDLLRKSDTASMAVGLEVRAPFLDTKLMDAALKTDLAQLMPRGQRKGLLRQVARKYFPSEIVDRPKMGFAIPIGEWFRSNYGGMRALLYDHLESAEPFGPPSLGIELNMDFIRQMLKEHDDAGKSSLWPWKGRDHSQRLYMLLVLSIWAKWLGGLRAA